jgi:hypothetical protein
VPSNETPGAAGSAPAVAGTDVTLADRVLKRMRELRPDALAERRGALLIHTWIGGEHDLYLDNLQKACSYAPDSCAEKIDNFARMATGPIDAQPKPEALLATLKNQKFIDDMQRLVAQHGQTQNVLAFPVIDDLRLVLVLDAPTATRFLYESDLPALGVTREQARQQALANLRARGSLQSSQVAPGLYGLTASDGYDSAQFLLQEQWRPLATQLGGSPVVVPIGRDIVLFASETDSHGLDALRLIVTAERQRPAAAYPITTQPYRWTPRGWVRFELPAPR